MTIIRGFAVVVLLVLFATPIADAQALEDDRYHLSMQNPTDWLPMSAELLAQTNAQVSHVTGRGFIAGYMLNEADTLVFPYMLVQFKPYNALPEEVQPVAKLDERGQLELLYALVGAFRQSGPLPDTIDMPQFIDRFGNDFARLNRLEVDEGRFDFAGKIPHEVGETPIKYHTHGVLGKDGIAITTVFTIEGFSGLTEVIQNDMRTLTFADGFTMAALPDEAPTPKLVETPDTAPTQDTTPAPVEAEPQAAETAAGDDVITESDVTPKTLPEPENPSTGHADSSALIIILSLLGVVLFASAFIAWFVAHKKAQNRREKRRARLERRHAAQASAEVQSKPRPASPLTAQSPGSTGRRKHEKTR
jgi:hypothetical protein